MRNARRFILLTVAAVIVVFLIERNNRIVSIEPLRTFVANCEPCAGQLKIAASGGNGGDLICDKLPEPPDEVIDVLDNHPVDDEYRKLVLLAYLKLHVQQIKLTRLSFETREGPFLFTRFKREEAFSRAFCKIVGDGFLEKTLGPEFLSASNAIEFIEQNNLFSDDRVVQRYVIMIDELIKDLEQSTGDVGL